MVYLMDVLEWNGLTLPGGLILIKRVRVVKLKYLVQLIICDTIDGRFKSTTYLNSRRVPIRMIPKIGMKVIRIAQ